MGFGFEGSDEGGGEVEVLFHFLAGVGSYLNRTYAMTLYIAH
ncbi:hypothetical protein AVDCRST_MAG84-3048 [uncultured Microcoleus sp.]|uniref:Uncharacterized protein n=1 Tax=uncultured Microcoleus sp. TaxID=259945 RepID=A0A6J4MBR8_9CYAN|nr:hypothetical protein AVDCRST_MAG84-3048 [uncultured Microcoleus sp.]